MKINIYQLAKLIKHCILSHFASILVCFVSIVCIYFVSPFSPRADVFGIESDQGIYATMSQFILQGELPLRDFVDMKGPIWMYLWGFAALLYPPEAFRGVFLIEVLGSIINSILLIKIFRQLKFSHLAPLGCLAVIYLYFGTMPIYFSPAMGSIGELLVPMILYVFYRCLRLQSSTPHELIFSNFIIGFLCAMMFWSKYTNCGAFIVYTLIMLHFLYKNNQRRQILPNLSSLLAGFCALTLPLLCWYLFHHALRDLLFHYFLMPYLGYGAQAENYLIFKIWRIIDQICHPFLVKPNFIWLLFLLILYIVNLFITPRHRSRSHHRFLLLLLLGEYFIICFFGNPYDWFYWQGLLAVIIGAIVNNLLDEFTRQTYIWLLVTIFSIMIIINRSHFPIVKQTITHDQDIIIDSINQYGTQPKMTALYSYLHYLFFYHTHAINSNPYFATPWIYRQRFPYPFDLIDEQIDQEIPDLIVSLHTFDEMQLDANRLNIYVLPNQEVIRAPKNLLKYYQLRTYTQTFILWERKKQICLPGETPS